MAMPITKVHRFSKHLGSNKLIMNVLAGMKPPVYWMALTREVWAEIEKIRKENPTDTQHKFTSESEVHSYIGRMADHQHKLVKRIDPTYRERIIELAEVPKTEPLPLTPPMPAGFTKVQVTVIQGPDGRRYTRDQALAQFMAAKKAMNDWSAIIANCKDGG